MKIMAMVVCLMVTAAAVAAPASGIRQRSLAPGRVGTTYYSVEAKVAVDGRVVMAPQAVVASGHMAQFELLGAAEAYRLQIVINRAGDSASNRALVNVNLLDKSAGNWVLRTSPSLVVNLGQPASMQMPYDNAEHAPHTVDLSVVVDHPSSELMARLLASNGGKTAACPANSGTAVNPLASTPGQPQCCHDTCADGSGRTMTCCGAVSCCVCGVCCSTGL